MAKFSFYSPRVIVKVLQLNSSWEFSQKFPLYGLEREGGGGCQMIQDSVVSCQMIQDSVFSCQMIQNSLSCHLSNDPRLKSQLSDNPGLIFSLLDDPILRWQLQVFGDIGLSSQLSNNTNKKWLNKGQRIAFSLLVVPHSNNRARLVPSGALILSASRLFLN